MNINGSKRADTLNGTDDADTILGRGGNDQLLGMAGNDQLNGGAGADTLIGGTGTDTLIGGRGADLFVFAPGDSGAGSVHDNITDFSAAEDLIDLSAAFGGQAGIFIGNAAFTPGSSTQLRIGTQNGTTLVQLDINASGHAADGVADVEIALAGTPSLSVQNFVGASLPTDTQPEIPPDTQPETPPDSAPAGSIAVGVDADLQALVNAAPTGATFWIEPGEHRLQSITPKDDQVFFGAEDAVLSGARLLTDFTKEGNAWVASDQTQEGMRRATTEGADGYARPGYPDAFFIDDQPQTHVDSLAEVRDGTYFFDYEVDKIYFGTDPTDRKVEAAVSPFAVAGDATNVVIQNLTIEKYATPVQYGAIGYNAPPIDWVIRDNDVQLNFGVGILAGDRTEVIGNRVHDNGQLGMGGNGNDILIEGNEIAHNGYFSGIDPSWEGGGTKFSATDGLIVRNNHSHDNNGLGLWTDVDNINTLYEGNRVEYNQGGGISHEISYAATIRDNTVVGNGDGQQVWLWGAGIQIQNSRDVEVYGNTVDTTGTGNGIALIQQDRGTGVYGEYVTTGNYVHDNIIISGDIDAGVSGAVADHNESAMLEGGNIFDMNEYRVSDPENDHWAWGEHYGWDAYRSATGQDANSTLMLL